MKDNNKLQVILKEQGIEKSDVAKLVEAFGGPFEEAGVILDTYKNIKVTKEDDFDGMAKARENRLILKKARTTVENKRKELKADIVKQGKAIDSVARFVKEEIEPAEKYLEEQEKFAELAEAKRQAELKAERVEKLMQYTDDITLYNLDEMTNEQFETLHATLKSQHEAKLAEEKRIEAERVAKEKAEAEDQERIKQENAKLKAEAEAKEKAEAEERTKREAEEKARAEADAKKEAEAKAEQDKIRAEAEAKIQAERKAREKLEAEQREREQAEAKAKAEKEEAERKALLAPDKEKILKFGQAIEMIRTEKLPAVKTKQAQDVVNEIDAILVRMKKFIDTNAEKL